MPYTPCSLAHTCALGCARALHALYPLLFGPFVPYHALEKGAAPLKSIRSSLFLFGGVGTEEDYAEVTTVHTH